jgi:N-methylhydantoinase B/oxoprolinase/acetone carboxylase alpha subunit
MKSGVIELELFRHILISVAEEMGIVLRKTAYSANIKERRDYSCAVYDHRGETVAMGDHMPVHLGAMPLSVAHAMAAHTIGPGDVVIVNDPFAGGTHLPDITAVSGVFLDNRRRPSFYLASRAHHSDVGGISPGSMPLARDIYQEGLRLPPVKLVRQGRMDDDLLGIILANVRTPEERRGDLLAQLMSMRRGETRLREIVLRYGLRAVTRSMRRLQSYTESLVRNAISKLPRGEYCFEDRLDNDGVTDRPVYIRVTIRVAGETAEVDFTGTDPQAAGSINANYAVAVSATAYVFRCLLDEDVPFTAGLLRPIVLKIPDGTVVSARPPAAMAAGNVETSQRITDVLLGALSKAATARIPAASSGTMNNFSFGGWDARRNRPFAYYETIAGGMGAGPNHPGQSAVHTHMTNSWNTPVEALEHQYPVRIRRYAIRRQSGGDGLHRGGDGVVREVEFLSPAEVTILSDRRQTSPFGLCGGKDGKPGSNVLVRAGRQQHLRSKTKFDVLESDVVRIETPGGGGFGSNAGRRLS